MFLSILGEQQNKGAQAFCTYSYNMKILFQISGTVFLMLLACTTLYPKKTPSGKIIQNDSKIFLQTLGTGFSFQKKRGEFNTHIFANTDQLHGHSIH